MNEEYQTNSEMDEGGEIGLTEETSAAIDDDWDHDDDSNRETPESKEEESAGEGEAEANQPKAEPTETQEPEETGEPEAEQTEEPKNAKEQKQDQLYTLEHFSGNRDVTLAEMKVLAQKGMDYDRKVDSLQGKLAGYEEFIGAVAAGSGLSPDQFMDVSRAKMLVMSEKEKGNTLTEAQALLRVQAERKTKAEQAETERIQQQKAQEAAAKKRRDEAITAFAKARPEVKSTDIPAEVWAEFNRSGDLLGAYAVHESAKQAKTIAELEKKLAAMENNAKAAQKSTGSSKSAGSSSPNQEFDALWYDGT